MCLSLESSACTQRRLAVSGNPVSIRAMRARVFSEKQRFLCALLRAEVLFYAEPSSASARLLWRKDFSEREGYLLPWGDLLWKVHPSQEVLEALLERRAAKYAGFEVGHQN